MSEKTIVVVGMVGYPKHGLWDRVDQILDIHEVSNEWYHESHGRHQYYYNSEGAQMMYFTNHSLPEGTRQIDVWSKIWDMDLMEYTIDRLSEDNPECLLPDPIEFWVHGQRYLYVGELWGYDYDSTSPDDERYEP